MVASAVPSPAAAGGHRRPGTTPAAPNHHQDVEAMRDKETMEIPTRDGRRKVDLEYSNGGLALHACFDPIAEGWTITHMASGLAIIKGIRLRQTGISTLDELTTLVDWRLQQHDLATHDLEGPVQDLAERIDAHWPRRDGKGRGITRIPRQN